MKRTNLSNISRTVLFVLIAALALCFVSCDKDEGGERESVTFTLTVVGPDGTSTEHTVTSNADNLADALLAEGLIAGKDDQYGLYITEVTGIPADFDKDGAYWSLYIGEEYAMTGVSSTPISEGDSFTLVYEVYTAG